MPSAAIFGNAKPVDTTQREKEIEEKLAKEHIDTEIDIKDKQIHHSAERKRSVSFLVRYFKLINNTDPWYVRKVMKTSVLKFLTDNKQAQFHDCS